MTGLQAEVKKTTAEPVNAQALDSGAARTRQQWFADAVAGLSVAGLLIPEAVAYAGIAQLAPTHALMAAIVGTLVYACVGKSRFAMVSPTSSSAAITLAAVVSLTATAPFTTMTTTAVAAHRADLAFGLVLLTGLILILGAVIRIGELAAFVSRPVLKGFAFGLAVTIIIKQLPGIAGVAAIGANPYEVLARLFALRSGWHGWSMALGGAALGLLLLLRRWPQVPGVFMVLVLSIALAQSIDLHAWGIAAVGSIGSLSLSPGLSDINEDEWLHLTKLALALVVIIFAESWGSMRSIGMRHGDTVDANRELLALGAANLLSGLVRGMPVGAGFSASSANEAAGANSRWAGVVTGLAMVGLMLVASAQLAWIPEPVLAAIVMAALVHALDVRPLLRLWQIDRDQYLALAAVIAVLALGVLNGMLVAVAISLVAAIRRFSQPVIHELGELGQTRNYVSLERQPAARALPGIVIVRPEEPLFFASADRVLTAVGRLLSAKKSAEQIRILILSLEESADLDSTAIDSLIEFSALLQRNGQTLILARVKDTIRDVLLKAGAAALADEAVCLWSVADAVLKAQTLLGEKPAPEREPVTGSS